MSVSEFFQFILETQLNRARCFRFFGVFLAPQRLFIQGPVVRSIVSLTSSLRGQLVKCFTTL